MSRPWASCQNNIRVVDPYTVEFQLSEPLGPFLVAIPIVSIVNPVPLKAHDRMGIGEKNGWRGMKASLVDQDQRTKLYEEAYRLVVADAADIWIYNTLEHVPLAKVVQGFQFSPVGSGQEFWSISMSGKA